MSGIHLGRFSNFESSEVILNFGDEHLKEQDLEVGRHGPFSD